MEHVLNLSYGKDSLACLEACRQLGYPVDRVIHAEVWATDTIPADLPPMVEFKKHADEIIKRRYGLDVEHVCATTKGENGIEKLTYEKIFYQAPKKKNPAKQGTIRGFPGIIKARWCVSLKRRCISSALTASAERESLGVVEYLGIAADEPERVKRHSRRDEIEYKYIHELRAKESRSGKRVLYAVLADYCGHSYTVADPRQLSIKNP